MHLGGQNSVIIKCGSFDENSGIVPLNEVFLEEKSYSKIYFYGLYGACVSFFGKFHHNM